MLGTMIKRSFTQATTAAPKRIQLKHLPYDYGALEPCMSGKTLEFHYGKHHRTYVNNLNNLLEQ